MVDAEDTVLKVEHERILLGQLADFRAARDAGDRIRAAGLVADMRARATLLYYCACGRNVAFLTWPTRTRALLWYAHGRGPGGYLWTDTDFWGTTARCPRCRREYLVNLADLGPWVAAGPGHPPDTLSFTTGDYPRGLV